MKPALQWTGGKTRMLKYILGIIPPHICYCEPFAGGLAVLLAKERSKLEVINDIHSDLTRFYRVARFHLDALLQELGFALNARADFRDYIDQPGLTDIQRAARWFMRVKLGFGDSQTSYAVGKLSGGGAFASLEAKRDRICELHARLDKVSIENIEWARCVKNYDAPTTFFFLDPPYVDCETKTYAPWTQEQIAELAETLAGVKAKWLLTVNDSAANRKLFGAYRQRRIQRVRGTANKKEDDRKMYGELIIQSWK